MAGADAVDGRDSEEVKRGSCDPTDHRRRAAGGAKRGPRAACGRGINDRVAGKRKCSCRRGSPRKSDAAGRYRANRKRRGNARNDPDRRNGVGGNAAVAADDNATCRRYENRIGHDGGLKSRLRRAVGHERGYVGVGHLIRAGPDIPLQDYHAELVWRWYAAIVGVADPEKVPGG